MVYITDTKHLDALPEEMTGDDRVVIFCREADTMRVMDANRLLAVAGTVPMEFAPADTKDEQLLAIGGLLEHEDVCTVLFPVSQVPKRYADRIKTVRRAAKKKPAKKAEKKTRRTEHAPAAGKDQKKPEQVENPDVDIDLPKPEEHAKRTDKPAHTDDPFRTETAHKEQEEARKKAGCGENDWWVPQENMTKDAEKFAVPETPAESSIWPEPKRNAALEEKEDARRKAREELLARADAAMAEAEKNKP